MSRVIASQESSCGIAYTHLESFPDVIQSDQLTAAMAYAGSSPQATPGLPPSLAGYMIIGRPMRGGMGTVWPAKQLGTKRTVAIKILGTQHLTSEGCGRFVREVELSAQLQHPNIARIYDSGVHQGDYFYAMEMVDGVPLDHYVVEKKLDQRQILELMRLVCFAVQHAHVRGVIHCDLKPANILVSEDGQPHVLDFGLARLANARPDGLTENGSAPGTPSWMSPEQAAGELERIDTRTDVYSLGKILYQLLTGQSPHRLDGPVTEVLHRIASEKIRPPRGLSRTLNTELCAILYKALQRDPERRYPTAGELGRDIDCFERGQPVAAMPQSTIYFLRKRMAKHRAVLSLAAVVLLALSGMAVFSYLKISAQNKKSTAITNLLHLVLESVDPKHSGGQDVTPKMLSSIDQYLAANFASQPDLEADLREVIGNDLLWLGQYEAAEAQFDTAVNLRRRISGENSPEMLVALANLAEAYRERGKMNDAVKTCEQVLKAREAAQPRDERAVLRAKVRLAYTLNDIGRGKEAEMPLKEALRSAQAKFGNDDPDTMAAAAALVLVLRDLGDVQKLTDAQELAEQTLRARTRKLGKNDPDTIQSMHDLATVLSLQGATDDAENMYRNAITLGEGILARPVMQSNLGGGTHPDLLIWKADRAFNLWVQGRLADAQKIYEQILPDSLVSRGKSHPYNIALRRNLGGVLAARQRYQQAEPYLRDAIEVLKNTSGDERIDPIELKSALASVLTFEGKLKDAIDLYSESLDALKKKYPADDPRVVAGARNLQAVVAYKALVDAQQNSQGGTSEKSEQRK